MYWHMSRGSGSKMVYCMFHRLATGICDRAFGLPGSVFLRRPGSNLCRARGRQLVVRVEITSLFQCAIKFKQQAYDYIFRSPNRLSNDNVLCVAVSGRCVARNPLFMVTSSNGTFSALLVLCDENPPITDGFPSQRPVTRSLDVFFDLRLNKRLSKQSRLRWIETPPRSLWSHCNFQQ